MSTKRLNLHRVKRSCAINEASAAQKDERHRSEKPLKGHLAAFHARLRGLFEIYILLDPRGTSSSPGQQHDSYAVCCISPTKENAYFNHTQCTNKAFSVRASQAAYMSEKLRLHRESGEKKTSECLVTGVV